MKDLKAKLLNPSIYDKHTLPTLWKAEQEAKTTGTCIKDPGPVNVTTQFIMDPTGLSIDQKSQTFALEGYLRFW